MPNVLGGCLATGVQIRGRAFTPDGAELGPSALAPPRPAEVPGREDGPRYSAVFNDVTTRWPAPHPMLPNTGRPVPAAVNGIKCRGQDTLEAAS